MKKLLFFISIILQLMPTPSFASEKCAEFTHCTLEKVVESRYYLAAADDINDAIFLESVNKPTIINLSETLELKRENKFLLCDQEDDHSSKFIGAYLGENGKSEYFSADIFSNSIFRLELSLADLFRKSSIPSAVTTFSASVPLEGTDPTIELKTEFERGYITYKYKMTCHRASH